MLLATKDLLVNKVDQGILQGYSLRMKQGMSAGTVIVFGGSEGGCNYKKAEELASQSFEVLALFFFGKPNLPRELKQVPIEIFEAAHAYVTKHFANANEITVLGESKGAELALVLGSEYSQCIDKIVGIVPSSHVFYGLGTMEEEASSWTKNGQEIPYLSLERVKKRWSIATIRAFLHYIFRTLRKKPVSFRKIYELCIKLDENSEEARIKIENFSGELLLIAGGDDQLWHSDQMVKDIQAHRPVENTQAIVYPGVGHSIGGAVQTDQLILGGTEALNRAAYEPMMERIIAFCQK